jgi:hypothetical protein
MLRKIFLLFALVLVGAFLSGCGVFTAPDHAAIVEKQANARIAAAKWQAKADIEKWKAVQELAKSGSDVGRTSAGFAVQADSFKTGHGGAAAQNAGAYYMPPDPVQSLATISREARGWLGLKYERDSTRDALRAQQEMRANDNATYLGFGQEIGITGRYGIDSANSLGSAAIQKIPSYTLPAPGSTATTEPAATTP